MIKLFIRLDQTFASLCKTVTLNLMSNKYIPRAQSPDFLIADDRPKKQIESKNEDIETNHDLFKPIFGKKHQRIIPMSIKYLINGINNNDFMDNHCTFYAELIGYVEQIKEIQSETLTLYNEKKIKIKDNTGSINIIFGTGKKFPNDIVIEKLERKLTKQTKQHINIRIVAEIENTPNNWCLYGVHIEIIKNFDSIALWGLQAILHSIKFKDEK